MPKKIIGRIDKVDFPLLDLCDFPVKIDTGAYTSSIHCHKVIVENESLRCLFYEKGHPHFTGKEIVFNTFQTAKVKSSNGIIQERYKVKTSIILFNKKYSIKLTLSTRKSMKYPVLIGRKFLLKKFIVDVNEKDLSFLAKNKSV